MTDRPDFRAIKARVSLVDVLRRYGTEMRQVNQYELRGKCPLPTHSSDLADQTFVVNPRKNVWSCHSASCVAARNVKKTDGHQKKGGDLIEFVAFMEKCNLREAGERLEEWFDKASYSLVAPSSATQEAPAPSADPNGVNQPLPFTLKDIAHAHPYLACRGFDEEECEYLGCGFFPGKGSMAGRIVFPIHNGAGELVGYAGRSIDDTEPRWKFPSGFLRGVELFNLHRVQEEDWSEVIVVESFWGVLACIRAGIMNAVSIMSRNITERQAAILANRFRRVTVMLDGDEYGREAIGQVIGALVMAEAEQLDIVLLPKGEQ